MISQKHPQQGLAITFIVNNKDIEAIMGMHCIDENMKLANEGCCLERF